MLSKCFISSGLYLFSSMKALTQLDALYSPILTLDFFFLDCLGIVMLLFKTGFFFFYFSVHY